MRLVSALGWAVAILSCSDSDDAAPPQSFQPAPSGMIDMAPATGTGGAPEPADVEPVVTPDDGEQGPPIVSLEPSPPAPNGAAGEPDPSEEPPSAEQEPAIVPLAEDPPIECEPIANPGSANDGDINVDLASELQTISGFGGINLPGWIPDLTPEQVQTAFGRGPGQLGLSLLRVRIAFDSSQWDRELPAAQQAYALGAKVFATPWTPPAELKSNNDTVSGELTRESYGAYADHLLAFRDFMAENGVPLTALSIQNEPDIRVDYESCDWTAAQLADFLVEQGPRFGDTRLIAAESFNFNRQMTDPLLQSPAAAAQFEIVGGHIYGAGLADYPLARERGKEVWMTEHYTDSSSSANAWPNALGVGAELHDSMQANFNAYVWWYIRRSYGLLTEDGLVSKRGFLMSQYARFVRPGHIRVAATRPQQGGVEATAYKNGPGRVVVVAVNESQAPQTVGLDVFGSCVGELDRFTTSQAKNAEEGDGVTLTNGRAMVTLDPQSVTTFVSR